MNKKLLWATTAAGMLALAFLWCLDKGIINLSKDSISIMKNSYHNVNINDIIDNSTNLELVKISGEITRKVNHNTYVFKDDTGKIKLFIDSKLIPLQGIPFNIPVVLNGEVEKSTMWPTHVDVETIRYVF